MSFLTLEDINTLKFRNNQYYWYVLDTSKVSPESVDYDWIKYDFVYTRRDVSETFYNMYDFNLDIDNFANAYYVTDTEGNYVPVDITWHGYDNNFQPPLIFKCAEILNHTEPLVLHFYIGPNPITSASDPIVMKYRLKEEILYLNHKELNNPQTIEVVSLEEEDILEINDVELSIGHNLIEVPSEQENTDYAGFLLVLLKKSELKFNCNQELWVGYENKVYLNVDSEYIPNGDMVGENEPKLNVIYNNKYYEVFYDETNQDYYFNLDLTSKMNERSIKFYLEVERNDVLNYSLTEVKLSAKYPLINNFEELSSICEENGPKIVKLNEDIVFTNSLEIKHNLKIIGCGKTLDLDGESIELIGENISLIGEEISFINGNQTIKQSKTTLLRLDNCHFENCIGFGACILCEIDYNSLNDPNDYITTLNNCSFKNNNLCIVHGGNLNIDSCKYLNNDIEFINPKKEAFLYQVDGEATITNSIFDLDYQDGVLCTETEGIGYSQSLIHCGYNSIINGATHDALMKDNSLPFFNEPYLNRSHIFAIYYYEQIGKCIVISPMVDFEEKSITYNVSGDNWIHKQNVQVTLLNSGLENRNNPINW